MKRILLSLFLALPLLVTGQTITLEQARQLALEHNNSVKQAALQEQVAEQAVRQYRAMFMPDLSLSGGLLYSTADGTLLQADLSGIGMALQGIAAQMPQLGPALAGIPQDITLDYKVGMVYEAGLMLKQPLYMGGKLQAAYDMARLGKCMAAQNRRLTDVEVIERVDAAYINVVRARELGSVAQRYLDMLDELERNVQSAVELGMKMNNDRLRVQVKKGEVELQLRRAENALRLATMNLNHITGQPLDAPTQVEAEVDAPATLQEGSPALRPEAELMQQRVDMAAKQVRVVRSDMLPSLALVANYGYAHGGEFRLNGDSRDLLDGMNFTGGVMLNVPLYHFGERQARLRSARLQQQMAQMEADDVNRKLELALAQARNNMDEALLEAQLSARSLQQAEENLRISQQQYNAGTVPLSDLLDAQAMWQTAYEQSIESRLSLHTAGTALQKAQGTLR